MKALARPEARLRAMHRLAWLIAPIITLPASYMCMLAKGPDAPKWLVLVVAAVLVPVVGILMGQVFAVSLKDLLVARLGSPEEKSRRLAEPPNRFSPIMSRAALALEAGDFETVVRSLDSLSAVDRKQPLYRLLRERKAIATAEPEMKLIAIDALLLWQPLARFGIHGELARYHAFILASALAEAPSDDARVRAAAQRLGTDRDFEVRAYATWLDGANAESSSDLLIAGAALARAAGRSALAQNLELRAARGTAGERAPYRSG